MLICVEYVINIDLTAAFIKLFNKVIIHICVNKIKKTQTEYRSKFLLSTHLNVKILKYY